MLLHTQITERTAQLFDDALDLSPPRVYADAVRNRLIPTQHLPTQATNSIQPEADNDAVTLYNPPLPPPPTTTTTQQQSVIKPVHPHLYQNTDQEPARPKTQHHEWALSKVLIGHKGWIRALTISPTNTFFLTGSNDTTIKAWDLATGALKLTLTSHLMAVRGLKMSERHPYLFSSGEDKAVKMWDLEKNSVVRDYHGHLSGVYSVDVHPTLDLLITGSRDSSVKVWDMRTSTAVMTLQGHKQPINQVATMPTDPQIVSTSQDHTIRLWDLRAARTQVTLTHHRKSVRALALHPEEWSMCTASADSIRQWAFPDGRFLASVPHPQDQIINTLSINHDGVLFTGADDGTMTFHDWETGVKVQETKGELVPGSLDSEGGVLTSLFDLTGSRLITGSRDKAVRIWKEV